MLLSAIAFGIVIAVMVSLSEGRVLRYKHWHNEIQKEHEKRSEMVTGLLEKVEGIEEDYDALYAIAAVTFGEKNVDKVIKEVKEARRKNRNG